MASNATTTPQAALHYTAALLYAVTIPKHTLVGIQKVGPATASIGEHHKPIKHLIAPTWQYCNLYLAISALLSIQWARTGGPGSREEKAIVWLQVLMGGVVGWEYFQHRMYVGLGVLWAAPLATSLAIMLPPA